MKSNDRFLLNEHGLFLCRGAKPEWIAQPFTARSARQGDNPDRGWGKLVSFATSDGVLREVFVSAIEMHRHPYKLVARLIDLGMRINGPLAFVEFLSVYDSEEVA